MTLFDMEPLAPAEVVRRRGYHPVTMLLLDPDEARSCGTCATRRSVWIIGRSHIHGDRWEAVCDAVEPRCEYGRPLMIAHELAPEPWAIWCGSDGSSGACEAECCAESARDAEFDGYNPAVPWPLASAVEPWMPACTRWSDLEAERVVGALGGTA